MKISVIGLGFVGSAMFESFKHRGVSNLSGYDKYKKIGKLEECLDSNLIFLALPTPYHEKKAEYDKTAIIETLSRLSEESFTGLVILKSTVEPETTCELSKNFINLKIVHNPEFLTERTALDDFNNQSHIVLGKGPNCTEGSLDQAVDFYSEFYPNAKISICDSTESESMKIFANSFYSVKVQFFNELYLLCEKMGSRYEIIKDLMLTNGWINPMHTNVPGPDGMLSYGGSCFPKDTNALLRYMKKYQTPSKVLDATVFERNEMRKDDINIIKE
jgi:UDPglucose 6-dehydrogenase